MRVWVVAGMGLALPSCVNIPPFHGATTDAPAGPCDPATTTVTTQVDGFQQLVCGPHYAMRFSDQGYHFPHSFVIAGREVLAPGATCIDETDLGMALYPAGIVNGVAPTAPASVGSSQLTVDFAAPFVVRIGLDWAAGLGSCAAVIYGRTSFSFFKDGRIARMDHIAQDSTNVSLASDETCRATCSSVGSDWEITTFSSFASDGSQTLAHGTLPATVGASDLSVPNENCLSTSAYQLGIGWSDDTGGKRLRRNASQAMALVADLETGPGLGMFDHVVRTTYRVSTAGCDEPTMRAYDAQDRQLAIGTPQAIQTTVEPARDGIYGGSPDPSDQGVQLANDDIQLTLRSGDAAIPGGWVVWVRVNDDYTSFAMTKNGSALGAAADFYIRPEDHRQVLFWFADALAPTDTIKIAGML